MNLAIVMDEIAAALDVLPGLRSDAFPVKSVQSPAAVVLYPRSVKFDETYGRGVDSAVIPVAVMIGRTTERSTKDVMGRYLSGGEGSIKYAVEHGHYTECDVIRVVDVDVDVMTMGGVDFWGAVFELRISGPGSR